MISKEQIAHELTMTYMHNRYGVDVSGTFNVSSYDENGVSGSGSVETNRIPSTKEPKNIKVGTGQKGFLGIEKKTTIQDGYVVDDIFSEMLEEYYRAYSIFLRMLMDKQDII